MPGHRDFHELRIAGDKVICDGEHVATLVHKSRSPWVLDRFINWIETFAKKVGG